MRFDKPVLLYGAGKEARSTRDFLHQIAPDAKIHVTADSGTADIPDTEMMAPEQMEAALRAGEIGLIVKSPGVSLYKPVFEVARQIGVPITSNLNLWGDYFRDGCKVHAISGTKGKSTTATLVHLMLVHSGLEAGLAGNVGVAPLDARDRFSLLVLELSSYQTADMNFAPDIAALTNLSPEHVDWHGSVERYYHDKLSLIGRVKPKAVALGDMGSNARLAAETIYPAAVAISDVTPAQRTKIEAVVGTSRLKGAHNIANALLAARIALHAGANMDGICKGIAEFAPLPHRLEEHEIGGKLFVDDSISTTPEATKAALNAYRDRKIALIAGGHERQQNYESLAQLLAASPIAQLVCLPVTGARLAETMRKIAPAIPLAETDNLDAAMALLAQNQDGFDTVILSPGAPSYNQFKNYEERGQAFIALAKKLFGTKL